MCWNIQISAASCLVGWVACALLVVRRRSPRDLYYARYLFTFTFTQLIDIVLWHLHGETPGGLQACTAYQVQLGRNPPAGHPQEANFYISKYVIPVVIFSQHAMQLSYPSPMFLQHRYKLIFAHVVPCVVVSVAFACTRLTRASFPSPHDMLFWGGDFDMWTFTVVQIGATLHSGLVAYGFTLIMPRGRVLAAHLLFLGLVVSTLWITEGRMDFGSKWCTYCLIFTVVYLAEPLWLPAGSKAYAVEVVPRGSFWCEGGEGAAKRA